MTVEQRLVDLFDELERQTVVPVGLRAGIEERIGRRRRMPWPYPAAALAAAAAVLSIAVLPGVIGDDGDRVQSGPMATAPPAAFAAGVSPACTDAARALSAVGPRFTTVAAFEAASAAFSRAVGPLISDLLRAVPPGDDPSLPARTVGSLRAAEADAAASVTAIRRGDLAGAGEAFARAEREAGAALEALVEHGVRCSSIGLED